MTAADLVAPTPRGPGAPQARPSRAAQPDVQIHVLLVEDSIMSARALQEALSGARFVRYRITQVPRLEAALSALRRKPFDIVVLDLELSDCPGIPALERVLAEMGDRSIPIVALADTCNERAGLLALEHGAQDYLVKAEFEGRTLRRILQHASERHRILTECRLSRQRERYLTSHDSLTELPTSEIFADRVVQAVASARRSDACLAVLTLDVRRLRQISVSLGTDIACEPRKIIAHRMLSTLRATDSVAQVGPDRFAVLLSSLAHPLDGAKVAHNLVTALARSVELDRHSFELCPKVGIAVYPDDGEDAESLLRNSDVAASNAVREDSRDSYFHTQAMSHSSRDALSLENELELALDAEKLALHFQPIVDGRDGRIVGAEALAKRPATVRRPRRPGQ